MTDWKSLLRKDPIDWLLERDNPSVRYFTLKDILERPESRPDVLQAKKEIMKSGVVPQILARQRKGGYWEKAEDFYIRSKYKGTIWQLIILAELGAGGNQEQIKKACEFIFRISQDRESGGFSYIGSEGGGGLHSRVVPCLTGNMVWSFSRLGYQKDPRVQRGIRWLTTYQRFDDGLKEKPRGWPYEKYENCWGRHTCYLGVIKALKALSEIPADEREAAVQNTIEKGADFILKHHVYKRSRNLSQVIKPKWLRFGFPLMWGTDVLDALLVLTGLGLRDERMKEAVDLVISKQDSEGRWKLENTFNGRFQVNIERKDEPSKWVTLNALRVLKRFFHSCPH